MKGFLFLALCAVLIVVGGLLNIPINPRTDGTIQTSFSLEEILIAAALLLAVSLFYLFRIRKRFGSSRMKDLYDEEDVSNLRAPLRSAREYRQATDDMRNSFSNGRRSTAAGGRTVISAFSGAAQYIWDGENLSRFGGEMLIRFDGRYISSAAGPRLFSWENNCLSVFSGEKLYSVSGGTISLFAGAKKYRFDRSSISEFAGPKLYSIEGDLDLPEAVIILIAAGLV